MKKPMKNQPTQKCIVCDGTGRQSRTAGPKFDRDGYVRTNKCRECNGLGRHPEFQMFFWRHDFYPYIIGTRGWIAENDRCYCPAYNECFQYNMALPMEKGLKLVESLACLADERKRAMTNVEVAFDSRAKQLISWAEPPNPSE